VYRPSVFLKAMRDQRGMVLGFGLGSALMAAMILGVYPSYRQPLQDFEMPPAFKALIGNIDFTTASGFLTAEFFGWMPALLAVYAIIQGTGVLAGEESSGTLDLLLAQPISRTRLFVEKAASIVVGTLAIVALILPGFAIPYAAVDIEVSLGRMFAATAALAPVILAFAALSLLAASFLPTRRDAAYVLSAVAVASYFLNSLGQAVGILEPLRPASLFFYYRAEDVLVSGVDLAGVGVLLGIAVVAGGLALALFQRRDIGVVLGGGLVDRLLNLPAAAGLGEARETAPVDGQG
jgi:ABC-2 type transport system permease protein